MSAYPITSPRSGTRIRGVWRRFRRSGAGIFGCAVVAILIFLALFPGLVASQDPNAVSSRFLDGPSAEAWFGTDNVGKDVFAGVVHGARVSLLVGVAVAVTVLVIGTIVGAAAGYWGGWLDSALMRVAELFQVMPGFLLAIVMLALLGQKTVYIVIAIAVAMWPQTARLIRAQVLSAREQEYVDAARSAGFSSLYIVVREILPNALPPAIVQMTLDVGRAILLQAGLAFLGLGDPNVSSWGEMLQRAQAYLDRAWWMAVFPGAAIFISVLGFNLAGDALNEALNPQSRRL